MTDEDRVKVDRIDDVVVVSLERTGFSGPARTVLLMALALPWLIVGPAFVLFLGGTVSGWVVAVGAVVAGKPSSLRGAHPQKNLNQCSQLIQVLSLR